MQKIISLLNQKGGVGKTTLATHIAIGLHRLNKKVLLVDSDPQGSAMDWSAAADVSDIPVVSIDRPTLERDLLKFGNAFDYIIIDGAPSLKEQALSAIMASDVILIPVQPSPYDVWATADLVALIKSRQQVRDGAPKAAFIISQQITNTKISKEVRETLLGFELPVFNSFTTRRVAFPNAASAGKTAFDTEPTGPAAKEMFDIVVELMGFIND